VSQALASALGAARSRLEADLAVAEAELAALVVPGSIRAEQLAVIERGVDVLVRVSLAAPTVAEPLDTRLACRFRFDDLGRIDYCVVMGEDPAEVVAFFRAAVAAADRRAADPTGQATGTGPTIDASADASVATTTSTIDRRNGMTSPSEEPPSSQRSIASANACASPLESQAVRSATTTSPSRSQAR
jgi:AcrR family transcriptional regulator